MCEGTIRVPALQRVIPLLPYFEDEHNSSGSVHKPHEGKSAARLEKIVFFQAVIHKNQSVSKERGAADGSTWERAGDGIRIFFVNMIKNMLKYKKLFLTKKVLAKNGGKFFKRKKEQVESSSHEFF